MSRIGNRVLTIPEGVNVTLENDTITVKGPKGSLDFPISKSVIVKIDGNALTVETTDKADSNVMQGTTNAIIKNMIEGVSKGFEKGLEIIGVGYRFQVQGNVLTVNAGYSHPVKMTAPEGLTVEAKGNTEITVKGIDKIKVGHRVRVLFNNREIEGFVLSLYDEYNGEYGKILYAQYKFTYGRY